MRGCPRFSYCDVPICPLDAEKDKRIYIEGDPRCTMEKNVRVKLGKDLPWGGLTPAELRGKKAWENKSPQQRQKFIEGGAKYLKPMSVVKAGGKRLKTG